MAGRKTSEGRRGLPTTITLAALKRTWHVTYAHDPARAELREEDGTLAVTSPKNLDVPLALLRQWLRERARRELPGIVDAEARRCGIVPGRLQFRIQKSRWGSRSATGTLSLNGALLFLDLDLVRHVIVHELCHVRHMNHSTAFKVLLARNDPKWMTHEARLRQAAGEVPSWVWPQRD